MDMPRDVTAGWRAHRPHLIDLAFRMLSDIGAAEDVVQEAFVRLAAATDVDDERAWLTVVTGRLCLDHLRSARVRRERSSDPDDFAAAIPVAHTRAVDPADRVTLDEEIRLALAVVLDRLSPPERVAFVLHDIFAQPFDAIAETLGKPAGTCRQLARRARQKVTTAGALPPATDRHREITEHFIAACAGGDIATLITLLHADAWGLATFPPVSGLPDLRTTGPDAMAANLLLWCGPGTVLVSHPACDRPAVLVFRDRVPVAIMVLTVEAGRIRRIESTVDVVTGPR
ncbi:RNA polymerase sigma factor SigI [Nocardia stercoris]|uniref:RNA polymerase sigma factor SigI n=1 Tax=Nocardia stercoris TaxID=2483361 RepID=A0A3M2KZ87_9NOCA|nr:RNA polymerase sigma factor SigI [Nocardia stercoris]RMI30799.1 RNA polymerase sigma factor SigI [Nocardia stercoris]